ncbi:MAG TPA: nickel-dependent hydrogenase large subunit [Puia sp.]|nr:nickel-dependent hydrogenase large subunit [Puia sp.]
MKILIGVIETPGGEMLFTMDNGVASLLPTNNDIQQSYPNYHLLKNHSLKIQNAPISGTGVFCFRYGPVMAGVKEAGSFNLYTYGEKILRASVDLSWKHRKIETAMINKKPDEAIILAERVCSNFAMAHSVAFCRATENALKIPLDIETKNWRIILLEAERVYNHLNVIYKLAGAAAQKVLAAHLCSLFEEALRMNECLTGSRYLMNTNMIGKIKIPQLAQIEKAIAGYQQILATFEQLYRHSLNNSNYLDRLHISGTLTQKQVEGFGLTGPSLRACGIQDDLNGTAEHLIGLPVVTQNEGDALARMETRAEEIVNSCDYIINHLKVSDTWKQEPEKNKTRQISGEGCGIANSASGALGYYIHIEEDIIRLVKICTPSYVGMHAVSEALKDMVFTDFPFVFDSFGIYFSDAAL